MYGGQTSAMMIFGGGQMQVGQCAAYWVVSVDWVTVPGAPCGASLARHGAAWRVIATASRWSGRRRLITGLDPSASCAVTVRLIRVISYSFDISKASFTSHEVEFANCKSLM